MKPSYKTYLRSVGRKPVPLHHLRTVKRPGDRELAVVQNANVAVVIGERIAG